MSETVRRKTIDSAVEATGQPRQIRFVISDGSIDRDNDTIDPAGWDLTNYRKNAVVLYGHDARALPVGKAVEVGVKGGKLVAVCEFVPAEIYPFAETVFQMYRGGFMRATSVGFRPIEYVFNEQRRGYDFKRQELLEFSCVPVPANPNALVSNRGADDARVKSWLGVARSVDEITIEDIDEVLRSRRNEEAGITKSQALAVEARLLSDPDVARMLRAELRAASTRELGAERQLTNEEIAAVWRDKLPAAVRQATREVALTTINRMRGRLD